MRTVLKSQLPAVRPLHGGEDVDILFRQRIGPYDRRTVDEIDRKLGRRRVSVPVVDF